MTSTFGWLDYDEASRTRMREIVGLLQDPGSIDELGLGRIRDAFSERFFPGTSVLWRRARYLLFVPWTYQHIERVGWPRSPDPERAARAIQQRLRDSLTRQGDTDGVIGLQSRDPKSPPDAILWAALESWGIRKRGAGTLGQYRSTLPRKPLAVAPEDVFGASAGTWHDRLPPAPTAFPDGVGFELDARESRFLRDLVVDEDAPPGSPGARRRDSMLAALLRADAVAEVDAPWSHPPGPYASADLRDALWHSGCFSDVMHGATILYALLLARARKDEDRIAAAGAALSEWSADVADARRHAELRAWEASFAEFWQVVRRQNPRIGQAEQRFVETWTALALDDPSGVKASAAAQILLHDREATTKGGRARLSAPRDQDRGDGGTVPARFTYRWANARSIACDIRAGLER